MSDDLAVIQQTLGLAEDDALFVLELCDMLDREDLIAEHGYPKDSPSGRNLASKLQEIDYRARLEALAEAEGADAALLQTLA